MSQAALFNTTRYLALPPGILPQQAAHPVTWLARQRHHGHHGSTRCLSRLRSRQGLAAMAAGQRTPADDDRLLDPHRRASGVRSAHGTTDSMAVATAQLPLLRAELSALRARMLMR